ncbi:hypothetical protein [Spirosoma areae]
MKNAIMTLLCLAPLTALLAQDLDWNAYPDGSFAYVYTNIGNKPVSATVLVTGATSGLAASGDPSGMANPSRLRLEADFKPNECVTLTITFSQPVGNLNFYLADVDRQTGAPGSDSNYQDQVTVTGKNGAANKNPTIGASSIANANTVSGNTITGTNPATNNLNSVNFSGDLTQVSIQYCSGSQVAGDPGTQRIFLSGLNWDDAPMPVRLVSFSGQVVKDQVELVWETSLEQNSDRFEVERSADARSFERIGSLRSEGFSTSRQVYTFWDETPQRGINYYRLRQVDQDATVDYSKVIAVRYEPGALYLTAFALTNTEVLVRTNAPAPEFAVYSVGGQQKLRQVEQHTGTEFVLHVTPSSSPQLQIIRMQTGTRVFSRKLLPAF